MDGDAWVTGLDRRGAADAVVEVRARLVAAEADRLVLAAHWGDLHGEGDASGSGSGRVLPGQERAVFLGGDGTPAVGEFAAAELGVLLQVSLAAAANLIGDALDLRHRAPMLWRLVLEGGVEAWKACKVARRLRTVGLSQAQCLWVDQATTPFIGAQPWSPFWDRLEAAIVAVDPEAAEERRRAAALERFVVTGQSNEYGLKTIVAKAAAGDAIFFVAMCDRIAQCLLLDGDTDPVPVRRSKAIGILADPARALQLLLRHSQPSEAGDDAGADDTGADDPPVDSEPDAADTGDDDGEAGGPAGDTGEGDESEHSGDGEARSAGSAGTAGAGCVACGGLSGDAGAFMRPAAVLHLHMSRESWDAARAGRHLGVARFEGVGPVTVAQAIETLRHTRVSIRPVLDLAEDKPVDGYEVPDRMREILFQRSPGCVFPWSPNRSRRADADHTVPYLAPDKGGPPGQTRIGNLGPLGRREHRVKTHAPGWRHHQPEPGVHLWRTPAGYWFQVDHRGTHHLGRHRDPTLPTHASDHARDSAHDSATTGTEADTCWPLADRSPLERRLADTLGWT